MTESLLPLLPLVGLALVLLFPFFGCTGVDPHLVDVARAEGEKTGKADGIEEGKNQARGEVAAEDEKQKYPNVILSEPHLVSYWRLSDGESGDQVAKDSAPDLPKHGDYKNASGGGVLRSVGGALSVGNDPSDKAAEFDGAKGFVEVPHAELLNPPYEFAIEAWVRPNGTSADTQVVLGSYKLDASGQLVEGFVLEVLADAAGAYSARARVGNGTGSTSIEASLEGGAEHDGWRHVVVSYSAAKRSILLYVNSDSGAPDAVLPGPAPPAPAPIFYIANPSAPLRIGAGQVEEPGSTGVPARFFKGRLDEVALYNAPLQGDQVKKHFLRGIATA